MVRNKTFAYEIKAKLNNDGSYSVFLFDIDSDESPIITHFPRARIGIEVLSLEDFGSYTPSLEIVSHELKKG